MQPASVQPASVQIVVRLDVMLARRKMRSRELAEKVGITEQTCYRWKRQYGGLESDQVRELKQVVEENARLKKLVAELSLDKAVLQDVLSKKFPGRRS